MPAARRISFLEPIALRPSKQAFQPPTAQLLSIDRRGTSGRHGAGRHRIGPDPSLPPGHRQAKRHRHARRHSVAASCTSALSRAVPSQSRTPPLLTGRQAGKARPGHAVPSDHSLNRSLGGWVLRKRFAPARQSARAPRARLDDGLSPRPRRQPERRVIAARAWLDERTWRLTG
jgi:hypothetical protein